MNCGISTPVVRHLPKVEKPVQFWYPAPQIIMERERDAAKGRVLFFIARLVEDSAIKGRGEAVKFFEQTSRALADKWWPKVNDARAEKAADTRVP